MYINRLRITDSVLTPWPDKRAQKSFPRSIQTLLRNRSKSLRSSVLIILLIALPCALKASQLNLYKLIRGGWYWLIKIDHQCQPTLSRLVFVDHQNESLAATTKIQAFSIPLLSGESFSIDTLINAPWRKSNEWSLIRETISQSLGFGEYQNFSRIIKKPFPKHPVLKHLTVSELAHHIVSRWTPKELEKHVEVFIQYNGNVFVQKLLQQGDFKSIFGISESLDIITFLEQTMVLDIEKRTLSDLHMGLPPKSSPLIEELQKSNIDAIDAIKYFESISKGVTEHEDYYNNNEDLVSPKMLSSPSLGIHIFPRHNWTLAALIPHHHIIWLIPHALKIYDHINPARWDKSTSHWKQSNYFPKAHTLLLQPPLETLGVAVQDLPVYSDEASNAEALQTGSGKLFAPLPLKESIFEKDTDIEPMDTTVIPQDCKLAAKKSSKL